jgi:uncharacterized OB-fold protein
MLEVANVLSRYGDEYLRKFGDKMLPSHRRAFADILKCRTDVMGGHVFRCDKCGHRHYSYHSCRNRSCPKCHKNDTATWLEQRREELLNVEYYHVVFTLPQVLRPIVRLHQKKLYGILMKSAAQAVIKLAADPHYIGGLIGVLCVLHTWSSSLVYHPHAHCLIPAGGISADKKHWLPARNNYLVPVKVLSKIFRGIFTEMVCKELPDIELPSSTWQKDWVVYCKPTVQGADKVLNYLGRYVHRVAITNSRIISIEDGKVTFRYKDSKSRQSKIMTLKAQEFIRRFLQHVLPKGVHKIRYYGLWSPANRKHLYKIKELLNDGGVAKHSEPQQDEISDFEKPPLLAGQKCPHCKIGTLVWVARIYSHWRAPP